MLVLETVVIVYIANAVTFSVFSRCVLGFVCV